MTDIRDHIQYNPLTGSFKWISRGSGRHLHGPVGYYNARGYLTLTVNGVRYRAASVAWYLSHGEWPKGVIDHKDHNPSNNRLDNLRDVPHNMNLMNRRGYSKNGLPKGVTKAHGSYRVQVQLLGRYTHIGTFKTLEEATAVAEAAHRKQWELAERRELAKREAPSPEIDLDELGL